MEREEAVRIVDEVWHHLAGRPCPLPDYDEPAELLLRVVKHLIDPQSSRDIRGYVKSKLSVAAGLLGFDLVERKDNPFSTA